MTYVSRDCFARTEVHKDTYKARGETCKWCGNTSRNRRLYEYRIESDGGRVSNIPGRFCSVSCMKAYHS
jgi:hypothetical protein